MRKWFVLSKRTVLSKRNVTLSFGTDNTIIIPISVLDEVQTINSNQFDERGKIAGELLDYLWSFDRKLLFGNGVTQENGSILKIATNYNNIVLKDDIRKTKMSDLERRILQTCLGIKQEIPAQETVILVSKNTLLRMKAELLGIQAQTFRDELLPNISEQYTGREEAFVTQSLLNEFFNKGYISLKDLKELNNEKIFYSNMFVIMKNGNSQSGVGRVKDDKIVKLNHHNSNPYGIKPLNVGQRFMIEALMADCEEAPLVIIKGPAGTAKTFISLAIGLELVVNQERYKNNILISRSPTETGEKLGYLPGGESAKIGPYLRCIMDNLKVLHTPDKSDEEPIKVRSKKKGKKKSNFEDEEDDMKPEYEDGSELFSRGIIKTEAIGFIRGRSICDTYIIIDEAQNLTPTEIKTIITRVGTGTKLIVIGDPAQIDRPELTERNNGLSYASERLKGERTCWQITMSDEESVRSELAKRASKLL